MTRSIWFWQRIVSPHMAGLAKALARLGHDVSYAAETLMSADREKQGWTPPALEGVTLHLVQDDLAATRLAASAPADAIHITQGLRGNGLVSPAQHELARRGARQWVIMETVDDHGWDGGLKRFAYRRIMTHRDAEVEGYLANGHRTAGWIHARGVPADRIFPFSYFLDPAARREPRDRPSGAPFRFIFIGQFIPRKRLDLLMDALAQLPEQDVELAVVGSGPLEDVLRRKGETRLGSRLLWLGKHPHGEIPDDLAVADCLVLPSRHDGWGAVVSEALMAGLPVICSDRCGAAGVVLASRHGGVFKANDRSALAEALHAQRNQGRPPAVAREDLARWASCLDAASGAAYLTSILAHVDGSGPKPAPPWSGNQTL